MKPRTNLRRGASLVLNLLAVAVFSILATVVYSAARTQQRAATSDIRQAQALAIAEAGIDDALRALYINFAWRTGYSNKAFANGFYTVTLTTDTPPTITSTGYSPPTFLLGRAVRTVTAKTVYTTGACPYAILADDIEIEGKVDAYDPTVSLQPCATCFVSGADIWANDRLKIAGTQTCPPTRMRGLATIGEGNALQTAGAGSAACIEGGLVLSTESVALPNWSGGSTTQLKVNNGSTTTLTAGTYNYSKVEIDGTLIFDTSTGTVVLNFDGNFKAEGAACAMRNTSKIPSRVHIVDASGNSGHTIKIKCKEALHAYLEGNANRFEIAQEVYGHYCGGSIFISSATNAVGIVHHDIGGGAVSRVSLKTTANSWSQSYKRQ